MWTCGQFQLGLGLTRTRRTPLNTTKGAIVQNLHCVPQCNALGCWGRVTHRAENLTHGRRAPKKLRRARHARPIWRHPPSARDVRIQCPESYGWNIYITLASKARNPDFELDGRSASPEVGRCGFCIERCWAISAGLASRHLRYRAARRGCRRASRLALAGHRQRGRAPTALMGGRRYLSSPRNRLTSIRPCSASEIHVLITTTSMHARAQGTTS